MGDPAGPVKEECGEAERWLCTGRPTQSNSVITEVESAWLSQGGGRSWARNYVL